MDAAEHLRPSPTLEGRSILWHAMALRLKLLGGRTRGAASLGPSSSRWRPMVDVPRPAGLDVTASAAQETPERC